MDNKQYILKELRLYQAKVSEVEKSPLQDRKDGAKRFKEMLENDLKHFEESIGWILNGSYGAGIQFSFAQCSKRMNRRAWLFNNLGIIEFGSSFKYTAQLWHSLDTDLQAAINRIIDDAIAEYDADPITVNV